MMWDRTALGQSGKNQEHIMSKGMDQKKNEKKKPAKTLLEKRAEKAARKKDKSR